MNKKKKIWVQIKASDSKSGFPEIRLIGLENAFSQEKMDVRDFLPKCMVFQLRKGLSHF